MNALPGIAYQPDEWDYWKAKAPSAPPAKPKLVPDQTAVRPAPQPLVAANTALHGRVVKMLAIINVYILAAFAVTLGGDGEALFMIAISAAYLLAYMGTPYLMGRVGGKHLDYAVPFDKFLRTPFETWTGTITGRQAMIQVLLVPAAIAIAVTGMCAIIAMHL